MEPGRPGISCCCVGNGGLAYLFMGTARGATFDSQRLR
jgi:hypothetical protein